MKTAIKRLLCALLLVVLAAIFVPELFPGPIQFAFSLAFGWIGYLRRVLPKVHFPWPGAATALTCLFGVVFLGHTFARWLWGGAAPDPATTIRPPWRMRWTLAAVAVTVLMFTAGIAATGISHQSAWLATMDTPIFHFVGRGRESANRVKCASNLRQIGYAIQEYAKVNGGQCPDSLSQLLVSIDVSAEVFICASSNTERAPGETPVEQARNLHPHHCDYVYHARDLRLPLPATRPIACEPLANHQVAGMNILFGDGHVEWHKPADARRVMSNLSLPRH
jgi:prepilin-type processing-associated H-X9-DG protein